jgi:hypothetical protein
VYGWVVEQRKHDEQDEEEAAEMAVLPVKITYDFKHKRLVLDGVDEETMKNVAKQLHRKKTVALQPFPEGFIVSTEGIYLSKANEESLRAYA